ncbi:YadA-like family protein [Citrobacter youngae]|uniref:Hep/Hag repeat protein n=1 Tax=Citrobacter youngae ATCC 29220 TaxID=500640 RepID=D4BIN0_9ENTR|nr:YadA-like family protein [Citrobacter youngae]EFE06274.1 Hep/Hag repeat protein [Citrobacter youngae ATCC 29220]
MNRIFKVIWNAATGTCTVTSETAKSRAKKSGRKKLIASALIGVSGLLASTGALANAGNDTGTGVTPDGTKAGTGWIAIGTGAVANTFTDASGASSAMGYGASAMGRWSTAIGSYSDSSGDSSLALGVKAASAGDRAIAMGASSSASGYYSMAMGVRANASGKTSVALGNNAAASGDDSAALGNGAKATGTNSVAIGAGSTAQEDNSVSVGNSTTQRKITYVANGAINASSSDAVTGAQIYAVSASIANRLGGGSTVNSADGTINAPTYTVGTGTYNNVGSALSAIDSSITDISSSVTELTGDALQWSDADGAFSAGHGLDDTNKITHLAEGTLTADSTDAVNGSQLYETNQNVTQNTTDIATNTTNIATNTTNIATNTTDIATNTTNIAANTTDIATNTTNIATNTTDIADLSSSVSNISTTVTGLTDDALLWDSAAGAFSAVHGANTASKITNVAAGTLSADSSDAVNGSQLYETNQNVTQNTTDIATNTTNIATNTTNIADLSTSISDISTTITGLTDDALMWDTSADAYSASHGTNATSKIANVAAGTLSADSTDAVNGSQLYETNQNVEQNTVNIATNTTNIADLSTSISDISTTITGLSDDALLWDTSADAYSASHGTNATSKITNVAAGALSADSTDAVNGSQLYETNQNVAQNTTDIAEINASITNLGSDALKWDETTGTFSASHGSSATNKITNVAAGALSADSTDAVNGAQLYETNTLIAQNSDIISNLAGDTSETYITENGAGVRYVRTNDTGLTEDDAHASGVGATAIGYNAAASGAGSLALGQNSSSSVDTAIALGSGSTSNRAISAGTQTTSVTSEGVVIGYDTTDRTLLGALSLGTDGESYRQITNVADGSEAQDAVTVRQLQNAISAVSTTPTKYFHVNSDEEDALAVGLNSIAVGATTVVNGDRGVGIGYGASVSQTASNGIAVGTNAQANHADSVALGSDSQTTVGAQSSYTAYNMDTQQSSIGEVSVGSASGQRQITNVAAGTQDTDAVNVAQLKVTDSRVAANTESITNLNTQVSNLDTRVTNIESSVGDIVTTGNTKYFKTSSTGADANAQGTDSVAIGSGSISSAENSVALGTNSVADEADTVSVGSSTQQRRITNVAAGVNNTDAVNVAQLKASEAGSVRYETNADGSVNYSVLNLGDSSGGTTRISNVSAAVNDTDAVNYAQLKRSVEEANTYTDQKMGEMNSKIKGVEDKMSGGIASAMAMAGLPQAYAPGANMTSIAGGTFNGESAVAIGVSMVSESGGWVYKLQGTSNSQGDYSAAIGAGFQW